MNFFAHLILNHYFFVYLFIWSLLSHSRIFHAYGDVTIAGEGLQIFYLCLALMAIEQ